MAPKNFLNSITIPSPCTADWNSMVGNDQVRFCKHCNLDVHNLSQMTRHQASRLVAHSKGRLCVRYHQDPSGKPLTLPGSRQLHRIGRRISKVAAGAFTATLSVTSAVAQSSNSFQANPNSPPTAQALQWNSGAGLAGIIKDQNGGLITNATVFVASDELKIALYASTNSAGEFRIDNLSPGLYNVRIEAPGFAEAERAVHVGFDGERRFDSTLSVATIDETVTVEQQETVELGGAVAYTAPENPFVRAAQENDLEKLTELIAGMDVNLRDEVSYTTALEHAVKNANREMVQLLLSAGADVTLTNQNDETVLMMLDNDATSDLVWDLLNAGADVNHRDDNGSTPLMEIAWYDNTEALKALLDAGADVNLKDEDGKTALMVAAAQGSVNTVRALVLAGANIDALDNDGVNALGFAISSDHPAVVRFLKSRGAIPSVKKEMENK